MPKRKDPDVPIRVAAAMAVWPGASAEKMEEYITRRMEEKIAENPRIKKIESSTRGGIAVVTIEWRSVVVLAVAIPVTLCMTYGFMHLLGMDMQQVSVASLIIALGLLVPVLYAIFVLDLKVVKWDGAFPAVVAPAPAPGEVSEAPRSLAPHTPA